MFPSSNDMSDDLIIRGSLEESSLPELLRSVTKSRESGILTCFVQDYVKSIYIQEGQIIFANSNNLDDRLGESLMRYGKISVRHFLDGSRMVRPGRRLGAILCDINAITPEELVEGVRCQVKGIIVGLFHETKGQYELLLKEVDTHEMILLGMSTEDIIFDGVKSIRTWSRISKGLGTYNGKLLPSHESSKILLNMTLSTEESHIFSLCQKGQFTIEEICGISYLTNFETCGILWAFLMVGAIVQAQTPEMKADREEVAAQISAMDAELDLHDLVENYNDLYAHLYDFAFQKIGEDAEEIASKAIGQVSEAIPNLMRDLRLDSYGRLDFDAMLRNLGPIPEGMRMNLVASALEEIVYALLFEIGSRFGQADQKKLTHDIQRLRKH